MCTDVSQALPNQQLQPTHRTALRSPHNDAWGLSLAWSEHSSLHSPSRPKCRPQPADMHTLDTLSCTCLASPSGRLHWYNFQRAFESFTGGSNAAYSVSLTSQRRRSCVCRINLPNELDHTALAPAFAGSGQSTLLHQPPRLDFLVLESPFTRHAAEQRELVFDADNK